MIYIDPLSPCMKNNNWRWNKSCHMFADTEKELIEFARKLKLRDSWIQRKRFVHYDLNESKRELAVFLGAKEVSIKFLIKFVQRNMNAC
jgi:hypothetical protein